MNTPDVDCEHEYTPDDAMETVLEIVKCWDDGELAAFLAECIPGEAVRVGSSVCRYDEKIGKVEVIE